VTDIAKIVGVSQPNMTSILQSWLKRGIVYQPEKNYVKLYTVTPEKEDQKNEQEQKPDGTNSQEARPDNKSDAEEPTAGE
jgi:hypothetical protein